MRGKNGVDLRVLPADAFLIPMVGHAGAMTEAKAMKIETIVASQNVERRKRGVRRALEKAQPVEVASVDQVREMQSALVQNYSRKGEWARLHEATQDLLLDAVAGLINGTVTKKDFQSMLTAARKELYPPTPARVERPNHATGVPLSNGW